MWGNHAGMWSSACEEAQYSPLAYDAMVASLQADRGTAFDRDYVDGQVDYQKGNAALFQYEIQNGFDADLKKFARQTLPKIEDHLHRALALTKQHR
jgi:putative membrane protein